MSRAGVLRARSRASGSTHPSARPLGRAGLLSVVLFASPLQAATWTVHPDGSGDAPTIQAAVDLAASGDTILLGHGTFVGAGNRGVSFVGRDLAVASISGAAATIIDCEQQDRAFLMFLGERVTFSGISIRNGDSRTAPGGGIFASASFPTVTDCVFEDNRGGGVAGGGGGGGIFSTGGNLVVSGCRFERNVATSLDGVGGGISVLFGSVSVYDSQFLGNRTESGQFAGGAGMMTWQAQTIVVSGCSFVGNTTTAVGGLFVFGTSGRVTSCEFLENIVLSGPGGMAILAPSEIEDCRFVRNSGGSGAALDIEVASTLRRCEFIANTSTTLGGAVFSPAPSSYSECTFAGNTAGVGGGALCISSFAADFDRCTFSGNASPLGAHVYGRAQAELEFTSSILAFGSGAPVACDAAGSATATCCDVFGNSGGDWVGCLAGQGGNAGNFSADPEFCDMDRYVYTLHSGSPCAPPGVTGCGQVGAHPVACGPVSVEPMGWARVKSLYRD